MSSPGETALVRSLNFLAEAQSVTSNNLANVNSSGFKRRVAYPVEERVVFDDFLQTRISQSRFHQNVDYEIGNMVETKDQSNIALRDKHLFFQVQTPSGVKAFARVHTLAVDNEDRLTTRDGSLMLDDRGLPITLEPADGQGRATIDQVRVSNNGMVSVGSSPSSIRLSLHRVDDLAQMEAYGAGYYLHKGRQAPPLASTNGVIQGMVEQSNVNAMNEMVELITNQRGFQSSMSSLQLLGRIKDSYVQAFSR